MARARKKKADKIALFPFLSVLICTIGVLTLILVSSVMSQGHEASTDADATRREYLEVMQALKLAQQELALLALQVREHSEAASNLAVEKKRSAAELAKLDGVATPEGQAAYKKQQAELGSLREQIAEAQKKVIEVERRLKEADPEGRIRAQKAPAVLKEIEQLKSDFAAVKGEIARVVALITDRDQTLKDAKTQLAEAEKKVNVADPTGILRQNAAATKALLKALETNISNAEKNITDAEAKTKAAEAEMKVTRAELEEVNPGGKRRVKVKGGSGIGFVPRYVECTKRGIVIHPVRKVNDILDLERFGKDRDAFREFLGGVRAHNRRSDRQRAPLEAQLRTGTDAQKAAALKALKALKEEKVVMLVRPSGVDSFKLARETTLEFGLTPGFLPVPTDEVELDLDGEDEDRKEEKP